MITKNESIFKKTVSNHPGKLEGIFQGTGLGKSSESNPPMRE
jgi:hypothetical protein